MKDRVEWIDIAKGMAMICIVAGHTGPKAVNDFVYLFHLSVFIFLSGYFYREEFSEHPIKFVSKRVMKLYLLYWIYETVFLLGRNLFFMIGWYQPDALYSGRAITTLSVGETAKEFFKICIGMGREPLIGAMWFVVSLMMIQVIYVAMRFVLTKLKLIAYDNLCVLLVFFLACIVSRVVYIPRLSPALLGLIFYHLGFKYKGRDKQLTINSNICILTIVLWLILLYSSFEMQMEYSQKAARYPLYFLATNIIGIICIVLSAKILEAAVGKAARMLSGLLRSIGQKSFDIMALHFCAFKAVSAIIILAYGLDATAIVDFPVIEGFPAWSILYIAIGIALPLIFGYARTYVRNKVMRKENKK